MSFTREPVDTYSVSTRAVVDAMSSAGVRRLVADSSAAGETVIVSTTEHTPSLWQMIRREAGSDHPAASAAAL